MHHFVTLSVKLFKLQKFINYDKWNLIAFAFITCNKIKIILKMKNQKFYIL